MKNGLYASVHAIERYVEYGFANTNDPKEEVEEMLKFSKKVGKTAQGTQIYSSGSRPEIRFVVKEDTCVTVLPPLEQVEDEDEDDVTAREKKYTLEMIETLKEKTKNNLEEIDKITLELEELKKDFKKYVAQEQKKLEEIRSKNKRERELKKEIKEAKEFYKL
jgi:FtsZ-binding cell division protein ZapB